MTEVGLINLLIYVIVVGIIFYVAWWGLQRIGLPEPANKIAMAVLVIIMLLVLLNILFGIVPYPRFR